MTATQTVTVKLKRPHAGQRQILRAIFIDGVRFVVANCGRRWGKSEVGKEVLIRRALAGGTCWWISPTYPMAVDVWKELKNRLYAVAANKYEFDRRLELITGGVIQVKSGHDPDALRGAGLDLAVLDEAAYMQPDVWQAAIRPALSDRKGSALFTSTPNGRNWYWSLWMMGMDSERYPDWRSFQFPTSTSPVVALAEIKAACDLLPERLFRQEYLAEFTEDAGTIFRRVMDCATAERQTGPVEGHRYGFGVDWARDNDFTANAIFDMTLRSLVALDRFNEIGWSLQRGRLRSLYERWKPDAIWAEANSIGGPNIEALQAEGLPVMAFTTTAQSKPPLIESLALAFEQGDISIINDPVLVGELMAYTMERLPSGRFQYNAPPGMHDDTVMAAALGWYGIINSGIGITFA